MIKPLFTKPRAGKLSPNRSINRAVVGMNKGQTRDVIDAADAFMRRRERSEPVRRQVGRGA